MVWNFSIIVLIFLLGFNLGGWVYGLIYGKSTYGVKLASITTLILLVLNLALKFFVLYV